MTLSNFVAYVTQKWKNKPDTSTPLSAERLTHLEEGIKGNSDAIQELAAAVVSQIVNNPDKIASMAALYAVDQKVAGLDGKIGDTSKLPAGTTDAVGAIAQLYSNLAATYNSDAVGDIPDLYNMLPGKWYTYNTSTSHTPVISFGIAKMFGKGTAPTGNAWLYIISINVSSQIHIASNINGAGWSEWKQI